MLQESLVSLLSIVCCVVTYYVPAIISGRIISGSPLTASTAGYKNDAVKRILVHWMTLIICEASQPLLVPWAVRVETMQALKILMALWVLKGEGAGIMEKIYLQVNFDGIIDTTKLLSKGKSCLKKTARGEELNAHQKHQCGNPLCNSGCSRNSSRLPPCISQTGAGAILWALDVKYAS